MTPNLSVNQIARKLRLRVPSALRAPAAGYLKRVGHHYTARHRQTYPAFSNLLFRGDFRYDNFRSKY